MLTLSFAIGITANGNKKESSLFYLSLLLLLSTEEIQANPQRRLVNKNFIAFVHCSSELNWILKFKEISYQSRKKEENDYTHLTE